MIYPIYVFMLKFWQKSQYFLYFIYKGKQFIIFMLLFILRFAEIDYAIYAFLPQFTGNIREYIASIYTWNTSVFKYINIVNI